MRILTENVLIVCDFANVTGGQSKIAIDTARLLALGNQKVTFLAASGAPDPRLDHPNIRVKVFGHEGILADNNRLRAMQRGIWNAKAARLLQQELVQHDPATTVLHGHGFSKALSPAIGPLMASGPIASVYTMHEYFLACPNGGFYDYQKNQICTRKALGAACLTTNCDARHPAHKAWRVLRQVAAKGPGQLPRGLRDIIYISDIQRRVMEPYLSPMTRLHHVPNPINLENRRTVLAQDNRLFLFVGRLNPEKGGLMFAKVARTLGLPVVFVGDGPQADAIRLANPDAIVTGWQTSAQVQDWMAQARALVMPSLWYEGQGLVALEALVQGIPVVTGKWCAASESVRDGQNGIIYDTPTEAALADALMRVTKIAPFDTDDIQRNVAPSLYLDRILGIYDQILSRHIGVT